MATVHTTFPASHIIFLLHRINRSIPDRKIHTYYQQQQRKSSPSLSVDAYCKPTRSTECSYQPETEKEGFSGRRNEKLSGFWKIFFVCLHVDGEIGTVNTKCYNEK
jgi:hypothetical protein